MTNETSDNRETAMNEGCPAQPVISSTDLSKYFGTICAVDRVSLAIPRGEVFGLVGSNGAGKSTLIRMLCCLLRPTSGTGAVAGYPLHESSRRMRQLIGYMSQNFSLYQDLTVEENINFFLNMYLGRSAAQARSSELYAGIMDTLGLVSRTRRLTRNLSEGWKQRLAFACAVIYDPPIVFLDEPTARVDPVARRLLWDLIHNLSARGTTFLVSTQFMDEAERCHRIGFLHHGRISASGTADEMRRLISEEDILVLRTTDVNRAFLALRDNQKIKQIGVYGDTVRLQAPAASRMIPSFKQTLFRMGVDLLEIATKTPTLDDVFVYLSTNGACARKREEVDPPA